jgi:hypothetical protein
MVLTVNVKLNIYIHGTRFGISWSVFKSGYYIPAVSYYIFLILSLNEAKQTTVSVIIFSGESFPTPDFTDHFSSWQIVSSLTFPPQWRHI